MDDTVCGWCGESKCKDTCAWMLQDRVKELEAEVERLSTGAHTCSKTCQRPVCVMRRERDALLKAQDRTCTWKESFGWDGEILHTTECGMEYCSEFPLSDLQPNYCNHCGGKVIALQDTTNGESE